MEAALEVLAMKFGLELEFFVVNKHGDFVVPPVGMRHYIDGGGLLVEARSKPMESPALAVASLKEAIKSLKKLAKANRRKLVLQNEAQICERSIRYAAASRKKDFDENSRPVFERFRNPVVLEALPPGVRRAGLHVHFSHTLLVANSRGGIEEQHPYFDGIYPVRLFDQEFAEEIQRSGRLPGAYRNKSYGLEYRSLPATIDLKKVELVMGKMLQPREFEAYPDNKIPDDEEDL